MRSGLGWYESGLHLAAPRRDAVSETTRPGEKPRRSPHESALHALGSTTVRSKSRCGPTLGSLAACRWWALRGARPWEPRWSCASPTEPSWLHRPRAAGPCAAVRAVQCEATGSDAIPGVWLH